MRVEEGRTMAIRKTGTDDDDDVEEMAEGENWTKTKTTHRKTQDALTV
jgi:hypothetical protein